MATRGSPNWSNCLFARLARRLGQGLHWSLALFSRLSQVPRVLGKDWCLQLVRPEIWDLEKQWNMRQNEGSWLSSLAKENQVYSVHSGFFRPKQPPTHTTMAARVLHNARLCLSLQMPPGGSGRPYFDHIVMLFPIIAICFFLPGPLSGLPWLCPCSFTGWHASQTFAWKKKSVTVKWYWVATKK